MTTVRPHARPPPSEAPSSFPVRSPPAAVVRCPLKHIIIMTKNIRPNDRKKKKKQSRVETTVFFLFIFFHIFFFPDKTLSHTSVLRPNRRRRPPPTATTRSSPCRSLHVALPGGRRDARAKHDVRRDHRGPRASRASRPTGCRRRRRRLSKTRRGPARCLLLRRRWTRAKRHRLRTRETSCALSLSSPSLRLFPSRLPPFPAPGPPSPGPNRLNIIYVFSYGLETRTSCVIL